MSKRDEPMNWRKSSHSGAHGNCVEVAALAWRKSSHSGRKGNCVEAAVIPGAIAARDSKNPDGPMLTLDPDGWSALTRRLRGVR